VLFRSRWGFQCSLPQWQTEAILARRLTELGGAVERGVTVTGLSQREDGVLVTLERADGTRETIEAGWVIGAGGAHSITRGSLAEKLAGQTYHGTALVADVRVSCGLPRDGSAVIATPAGYLLLSPLPGGRWITFAGDLDDDEIARSGPDGVAADAVAAVMRRRVGDAVSVRDVGWASHFRMHRRLAPRLAGPRRFLVGDAGHLSSPFGGEGLNSGLDDAHNLGWKLALELRGRARPRLLASFATERHHAARHVLDVSDRLHRLAHGAVEAARTGVRPAPPSHEQLAELARARAMIDVSYPASPLSGERVAAGAAVPAAPGPGDRHPDRVALTGTRHHLLLHGAADEAAAERLRRRWHGLVDISAAPGDPSRSGLPVPSGEPGGATSGAVLVRPDGHIGFRAVPADAAGLDAIDAHLACYLTPAAT